VPGRGERDLVRKARVEHVERTQVDRELQVEPVLVPGAPLQQRFLDDESPELLREPTSFRVVDELARRKQSPLRMLPANKRLDASYLVRQEVRLRLVVHAKLAGRDRVAELRDDSQAVVVASPVGVAVDLDASVAVLLRCTHSG
jgi:hypothetical protein